MIWKGGEQGKKAKCRQMRYTFAILERPYARGHDLRMKEVRIHGSICWPSDMLAAMFGEQHDEDVLPDGSDACPNAIGRRGGY